MTPTNLNYPSGGISIATEVYKPSRAPKGSAVILAYGSDGFVDNTHGKWATMIREDAADLAAKGFHVLVPDYFLRTRTPANSIDYERGGGLTVGQRKSDWQSTLSDSLIFARTLAGGAAKVGLIGYSLGAYLSLRLRAQAHAVVAFFPPFMDGLGDDKTPGLPIEVHYGDQDPLYLMGDKQRIELALRTHGASVNCQVYPGANHGFTGPDSANTNARHLSRLAAISLLERSL